MGNLQQIIWVAGEVFKGQRVGIFVGQPNTRENVVFCDNHLPLNALDMIEVGPTFLEWTCRGHFTLCHEVTSLNIFVEWYQLSHKFDTNIENIGLRLYLQVKVDQNFRRFIIIAFSASKCKGGIFAGKCESPSVAVTLLGKGKLRTFVWEKRPPHRKYGKS